MKKFKRIVALLLAGVLALSMMTGCSAGFYDEEGEAIKEIALEIMNEERDDPLENDRAMALNLLARLNKIDPDTGELDPKVAYERKLTGAGTQYQTYELYLVDGWGYDSDSDDRGFTYFLDDGKRLEQYMAIDWRGGVEHFENKFENYIKRALEDKFEGYEVTSFAIAYKVLYDDEGYDYLCVAFAFKVEGAPAWNDRPEEY